MYPEHLTKPMKQELVGDGFSDLTSPDDVTALLKDGKGTALLVVNSVCGCAAGTARPGVRLAVQRSSKKPDQLATVFAGVDKDAVNTARNYMMPYPPSSPSIALFKDGQLVHFLERHHIEGNSADAIAANLKMAFDKFC